MKLYKGMSIALAAALCLSGCFAPWVEEEPLPEPEVVAEGQESALAPPDQEDPWGEPEEEEPEEPEEEDEEFYRQVLIDYGAVLEDGELRVESASLYYGDDWSEAEELDPMGYYVWRLCRMWRELEADPEEEEQYLPGDGGEGWFFSGTGYEGLIANFFDVEAEHLRSDEGVYDGEAGGYRIRTDGGTGPRPPLILEEVERDDDLRMLHLAIEWEEGTERRILTIRMEDEGEYRFAGYRTVEPRVEPEEEEGEEAESSAAPQQPEPQPQPQPVPSPAPESSREESSGGTVAIPVAEESSQPQSQSQAEGSGRSDAERYFTSTNLLVYDKSKSAVEVEKDSGSTMFYSSDGSFLGQYTSGKVDTAAGYAGDQGAIDAFNDYRGVARSTLRKSGDRGAGSSGSDSQASSGGTTSSGSGSGTTSGGSKANTLSYEDLEKYAEEVVRLTNKERTAAGLHELEIDWTMMDFAMERAVDLETKFSHTLPDGTSITAYGYGENIHYGTSTPAAAVKSWMNSSGHKANILRESYNSMGAGCYQDEKGTVYWVQLFSF